MDVSPNKQLHEQIIDVLRDEVGRMTAGARLPSDRELAKRFGVSNVTVRAALIRLVEERYVHRRQGSGTYVLPRRERQHVGVVVELDLSHPRASTFFLRSSLGTQTYLQSRGYQTKLYVGHSAPPEAGGEITCEEFFADLAADRLLGLMVINGRPESRRMKELEAKSVPVVGFPPHFTHHVSPDYLQLIRRGIRWLAESGCERIGLIGWGEQGAEAGLGPEAFTRTTPRSFA